MFFLIKGGVEKMSVIISEHIDMLVQHFCIDAGIYSLLVRAFQYPAYRINLL